MTMNSAGVPALYVTKTSRADDAAWEAVREAIAANWTPEQFRREAALAWEDELREEARHARKVLDN